MPTSNLMSGTLRRMFAENDPDYVKTRTLRAQAQYSPQESKTSRTQTLIQSA
jgi:hypothetical protein